jgi:hypothetical protein
MGKDTNIKLISLLAIIFLLAAKSKDPIVMPVTENTYLTLKDLDQIKVMFFGYIGGFAIWAAKTIYEMFVKKTDSTSTKIDELIEEIHRLNSKVDRIGGRLEYFSTKSEVHDMINKQIEFYDGLRK